MSSMVERTSSNPLYYFHYYKVIKEQFQIVLNQLYAPGCKITHECFVKIRTNMTHMMMNLHELNRNWKKYISKSPQMIGYVYERSYDRESGQEISPILVQKPVIGLYERRNDRESGQEISPIFVQRPVVCLEGNPHLLSIHKEKEAIQKILEVLQPEVLKIALFFQNRENRKIGNQRKQIVSLNPGCAK